jgi:DNA-directed RNA polymerase specialized sigma subunit
MPRTTKNITIQKSKSENPEFRDKNALIHKRWLEAKLEVEKAKKNKNVHKLNVAMNKLEMVKNEFYDVNKGLAYSMAKVFMNQGDDLGKDYLSAAGLGLWEAFLRWDPSKNVTFGTFSRQFIKGRVSRTVRQSEYHHISQGDFNKRKDVRDALLSLSEELNRTPTYQEIALRAKVTVNLVERALQSKSASLDSPIGDGESTLGDLVIEKFLTKGDYQFEEEKIEMILEELSETELWIMLGRGDILGIEPQSLIEIADRIGIGREIARRVEQRAKFRIVQAKLALELDSLPSIDMIAEKCEYSITSPEKRVEFTKILRSGYSELKGRWERATKALSTSTSLSETDSTYKRNARLDRIGEEFIASAEKLITQMGSTYARSGKKEPVGIDAMSIYIWQLLRSWDEFGKMSFEAYARVEIGKNFSKLNSEEPDYSGLDQLEIEYLWSRIKKHNIHKF